MLNFSFIYEMYEIGTNMLVVDILIVGHTKHVLHVIYFSINYFCIMREGFGFCLNMNFFYLHVIFFH